MIKAQPGHRFLGRDHAWGSGNTAAAPVALNYSSGTPGTKLRRAAFI